MPHWLPFSTKISLVLVLPGQYDLFWFCLDQSYHTILYRQFWLFLGLLKTNRPWKETLIYLLTAVTYIILKEILTSLSESISLYLARKCTLIFVCGHFCFEKWTVFWTPCSRKTVSFQEQIMSKNKYPTLLYAYHSTRALIGCWAGIIFL